MSLYYTLFEKQENKLKTGIVGMIIITSILAGVFHYEANAIDVANLEDIPNLMGTGAATNWSKYSIRSSSLPGESSYLTENSEDVYTFVINHANIRRVIATLTWQDEAASSPRHNNLPDIFSLTIDPPNGSSEDSGQQSDGDAEVTVEFTPQNDPYYNGTGEYKVTVSCYECGNQELWRPGLGLQDIDDTGNDWTLAIEYQYYEKSEE